MFYINIDLSGLEGLKELESAIKDATASASRELAAMTNAKIIELAGERLHSRRQLFIDALGMHEEDGAIFISLDASAHWIEDGMTPREMLEDLLASPKAIRAKDGSMILRVPFEHGPGKGPTNSPASTADLVSTVKAEMKRRGIPWGKIEKDAAGRPKLGKLHKFSIEDSPLKTGFGAGQGHGPVGDVKQGMNMRQRAGGGPGGGGIPFLRNIAVYQKATEEGKTKRSVMTFRTASSKQAGQGMWHHPGLEATHSFEDGGKWAEDQIDKIVPAIIERLVKL